MDMTPMYLTTNFSGARARVVEQPERLSNNVLIDPDADMRVLLEFLVYVGVVQSPDVGQIPVDRFQSPQESGEGLILVISPHMEGDGFSISTWELLPAGSPCALAYGSPLMPEPRIIHYSHHTMTPHSTQEADREIVYC